MSKAGIMLTAALLSCAVLFSQVFTSSITGILTDPAGAVVPGAEVTLTNTNTGDTRKLVSNESGRYTFSQLLPSSYSLLVKAKGFRELSRVGIELTTNRTAEVNMVLELGSLSETVEVSGAAPVIDTQSASQAASLNDRMMTALPQMGGNALGLVLFSAGVSYRGSGSQSVQSDQNVARWEVVGVRENGTSILIDGIPSQAGEWGGLIAEPAMDDVQEVQFARTTYDAQYGRTGGGVVTMTTKGGTQEYHGRFSEYFMNDHLNANSFFNNFNNKPKSAFSRNRFGATIAGPIWRAKRITGLFGYEGWRAPGQASRTATLPTDLQRGGDFSQTFNSNGTLQKIYDPFTTRPDPARPGFFIRDPFGGNLVPTSSFDPVSVKYVSLIPHANVQGAAFTNANNYYATGGSRNSTNRYDARVDWAINDKLSVWGRLTKAKNESISALFYNTVADTSQNQINPRWQLGAGGTYIISPSMVVTVLAGASGWLEQQLSPYYGFDFKTLGFPASVAGSFDVPTGPAVSMTNYSGFGQNRDLRGHRRNYTLQVNVSKELTSHSLKFGWTSELQPMHFLDGYSPTFNFSNNQTIGPDPDTRSGLIGNSFASMLVGFGDSGSAPIAVRPATSDSYYGWYVQDAWRATRKLTVNYGIRYDIQQARTERFNRLSWLDYNSTNPIGLQAGLPNLKGGLEFASADRRSPWKTPRLDFAPRVGLAYSLMPQVVIRAGYGLFFVKNTSAAPTFSENGYSTTTDWVTSIDGGRTPVDLWSKAFSGGILSPPGSKDGLKTLAGSSISGFDQQHPTPYVQQFSLDVQYGLGSNMAVEVGYSGIQGRKLVFAGLFERNQLPSSVLAQGSALNQSVANPFYGIFTRGSLSAPTVLRGQLLRPYPQFTSVTGSVMGSSSSFNALSTKFTRRFSKGLTMIASYMFSKEIDNSSNNETWIGDYSLRDANNASLDRSIGWGDIPHSMAVTFTYELPVGKGRQFGSGLNRMLDAVVGGWNASGIYKLESGQPLHFSTTDNTFSYGRGVQYPNISDRSQMKLSNPTRQAWFNTSTSVFSQPAPFTYGNAPRFLGDVRQDHGNNMDLGIMKDFSFTEKVRLQLRAELFNAFNRNRFSSPNTTFGSTSFGQVTGSWSQPRNIQVALRLTF